VLVGSLLIGQSVRVKFDQDRASEVALEHLASEAAANPFARRFDLVVTKVEDVGDEWRVFYQTREFAETRNIQAALFGNRPLLVSRVTGVTRKDTTWEPPGGKRFPPHSTLREALADSEPPSG
jgi:hypothetical protein